MKVNHSFYIHLNNNFENNFLLNLQFNKFRRAMDIDLIGTPYSTSDRISIGEKD